MKENIQLDFEISKKDMDFLKKLDNFHYDVDYFTE